MFGISCFEGSGPCIGGHCRNGVRHDVLSIFCLKFETAGAANYWLKKIGDAVQREEPTPDGSVPQSHRSLARGCSVIFDLDSGCLFHALRILWSMSRAVGSCHY